QAISFDVSNAITLHRDAADRASETRRQAIDTVTSDFSAAFADVVGAIKKACSSLRGACSTMKEVADDTLSGVASVSSAAAKTTDQVETVGAATEELSGSIEHIGQQTTRGLEMARAAVGDAQRTQQAIHSLNEAAERIGSVVGLISA